MSKRAPGPFEHFIDERHFLELVAAMLRAGQAGELDGILSPAGEAGPTASAWLAGLLDDLATSPDESLRALLRPGRGRPRLAESLQRRAVIAYGVQRSRGHQHEEALIAAAEALHCDRRTLERRLAAAESSGHWTLKHWKDGSKK